MGNAIDLTGLNFNNLTAKYPTDRRAIGGGILWACECDCGNPELTFVVAGALKYGGVKTCGCSRGPGYSYLPEFSVWMGMRARCSNPNHKLYKDYGGRGITVCERWEIFENFYMDVGPRPTDDHWIDRYPDNNSGYRPDNVRWATPTEQQRNRRSNVLYTIDGATRCLTEMV